MKGKKGSPKRIPRDGRKLQVGTPLMSKKYEVDQIHLWMRITKEDGKPFFFITFLVKGHSIWSRALDM